jgi:FkbM family methyltransferase
VVLAGLLFGSGRWRRPVKLRLDAPSGQIDFIVPDYAAFKALGQVFADCKYDVATEQAPRSILDVGAHIGISALFFRRRFPSARIVAIEASPNLIPILTRNTRELNVEVHHLAVARSEGTIYFEESKESWAGTMVTRRPSAAAVEAVTLDSLLLDSVDLVKISVGGGAEFDILPACERLDQVRHVMVEAQAAPGTPRSNELLESLESFDVSSNQPGPLIRHTLFKARRPR